MSNVPANLRYAKSHEWLKIEGDITYVQLPKVGATLKAGETFGVVESVKAASDLYAPVAGTVIAINVSLDSAPESLNTAPYDAAWMMKLQLANPTDAAALLDAEAYTKLLG
jgi:glycine cleavage system H protein